MPRSGEPLLVISDRSRPLMLVLLVSCAVTVAATRLFLVLTGYPQVGGSTYHIAHALWGGLCLVTAGILAIVIQNRDAVHAVALLTGVGFGLFVDEVGKFITQRNDYFFPLAAPIVYASLLAILGVTELASRRQLRSPRAHLLAAISLSQTLADGTVTKAEVEAMAEHIRAARQASLDEASTALLDGLEAATALADRVDDSKTFGARWRSRLIRFEEGWLPAERARRLARLAMAGFCAAGLLQVCFLLSALWSPSGLAGRLVKEVNAVPVGTIGQVMQVAVVALGGAVAVMAGLAVRAMRPAGSMRGRALRLGYAAMLTLLLLGNLLSSYVDQFAVLVEASLQVVALGLLARWDRATRRPGTGPG